MGDYRWNETYYIPSAEIWSYSKKREEEEKRRQQDASREENTKNKSRTSKEVE